MIKKITLLLFILSIHNLFSQVIFVIEKLPKNTPKNAAVYISGDFEGWTGGQGKYKLSQNEKSYYITLPEFKGTINFKFTQGSWDTVETNTDGNSLENRNYAFSKKNDTIKFIIHNWSNISSKKSTATKNVFILSEKFYIPQLDRNRKIWIYLPPKYSTSKKSYPVLYMHDGQNLFDTTTSYAGEWEVDETLNKLHEDKGLELIVIGIDNGGKKRMDEYSPWKHEKYGGGEGDAYIDFIVKTLKPFVDENYRTNSEKNSTAIIGSSMGGLISYYAGLKYPNTFGLVGVFSPSFWFSDLVYKHIALFGDTGVGKMYFLAGDRESPTMVSDMNKVIELMKADGFNKNNIKSKVVIEGEHNEKLWRENFKETILWLFN